MIIIIVDVFMNMGRRGSCIRELKDHEKRAPPVIVVVDIRTIAKVGAFILSLIIEGGALC